MKRYIAKSLCVFGTVALLVLLLNMLCNHIIAADTLGIEKFNEVPKQISVFNTGGSHGLYGFDYSISPRTNEMFNFALESQSLNYDCNILEYYEDYLEDGGTAFLVVSYPSLFGNDETDSESFKAKNRRYYHFLPSEYIRGYEFSTALEEKIPVITADGTWKSAIQSLLDDKNSTTEYWDRTADMIDIDRDAADAAERHVGSKMVGADGALIENEEKEKCLRGMIELCQKKNINVYLITTPFLREYYDAAHSICSSLDDQFYGKVEEICMETGIEYLDYSTDGRFCEDYSLFMNSDHLNRKGAQQFTRIVFKEVGIEG